MNQGRIISFYACKGGVGRSMTLANVAWILASNGLRVLVLDWDLDAPGVHQYFHPFLPDPTLGTSDGVIDYLTYFASESASGHLRPDRSILHYAASLNCDFAGGGTIDFVGPGRQDETYGLRVTLFNWQSFYERLGGNDLLQRMKEDVRAEYDFVLIDSRSGISDYAGICTVVLPDSLVVCFTLSHQGLAGAVAAVEKVQALRLPKPPVVFPVPMRVDHAEKEMLERGRADLRRRFEQVVPTLTGDYWGRVECPYVPYYAYSETLAVFADQPFSTASVLNAAESLTSFLTDGRITRAVPLPPESQQKIRHAYPA